jgi:hypothetical protein
MAKTAAATAITVLFMELLECLAAGEVRLPTLRAPASKR